MKEIKITISIHVPNKFLKTIKEQMDVAISLLKIAVQAQSKKIDFDIRTQVKDL